MEATDYMTGDESQGVTPSIELESTDSASVEIQRRDNERRSELLDIWARTINWWLTGIAVFMGIGGFIGFTVFNDLEMNARSSVEKLRKMEADGKRIIERIQQLEKLVEDNQKDKLETIRREQELVKNEEGGFE